MEDLQPDGILFVGDLSETNFSLLRSIKNLSIPKAVIFGNHDRGHDQSGELLKQKLTFMGDIHCGWVLKSWDKPSVSIVGGRPCSAGGGYYLSLPMKEVYGSIPLEESVNRIVEASRRAPSDKPLVVLSHSGPSGLGSEADSLCGRDWKPPAIDWGDTDLALAIAEMRKYRAPELVVFGHMHHDLKRTQGKRRTFYRDIWGTCYLNAACVPRRGVDQLGHEITHFSWVEFVNGSIKNISHRWYLSNSSLVYEEKLFNTNDLNNS